MAQWRVWNMHPNGFTHKEMFRGDMIEIKANQYRLMDYEDAVQFKGQYFPMIMSADGTHDPKGFKVLKLEAHTEDTEVIEKPKEQVFVCQFDGKKFTSQAELEKYTNSNYGALIFKDETLDKEIETKKGKNK
jgi:hypothetical protein